MDIKHKVILIDRQSNLRGYSAIKSTVEVREIRKITPSGIIRINNSKDGFKYWDYWGVNKIYTNRNINEMFRSMYLVEYDHDLLFDLKKDLKKGKDILTTLMKFQG